MLQKYLRESLLSLLCFIIHGQGSSEKSFKILSCETKIYLIAVVGRGFAANSKYFVCFNEFYAGKGFCDIFRPN